ncbi:hypothetical protein [Haliangium sp.]|uniref:hypothetical protein n=1 Tax=Haliangium sp. TaxID=2663208 RepID=UPI003D0EBA33
MALAALCVVVACRDGDQEGEPAPRGDDEDQARARIRECMALVIDVEFHPLVPDEYYDPLSAKAGAAQHRFYEYDVLRDEASERQVAAAGVLAASKAILSDDRVIRAKPGNFANVAPCLMAIAEHLEARVRPSEDPLVVAWRESAELTRVLAVGVEDTVRRLKLVGVNDAELLREAQKLITQRAIAINDPKGLCDGLWRMWSDAHERGFGARQARIERTAEAMRCGGQGPPDDAEGDRAGPSTAPPADD